MIVALLEDRLRSAESSGKMRLPLSNDVVKPDAAFLAFMTRASDMYDQYCNTD